MEDDLITFCRENQGKVPWSPAAEVWAQIRKAMSEPVKSAKGDGLGKAQTASERRATTRGLGLNRDDPDPALTLLTASTSTTSVVEPLHLILQASAGDRNS